MLTEAQAAGSRMQVLDWLDSGLFTPSINDMVRQTEFFVPLSGKRMPKGWHAPTEARLGKECETLIEDGLNSTILNWWLAVVPGANIPNWDLACEALYRGNRPALVLAEAKAHVKEFTDGRGGGGADNPDNRARIQQAITEAATALQVHAAGVNISYDKWYQFSNRVAFAWKLASHGIPTVLLYLGFAGDHGISNVPLRDDNHWRETVLSNTEGVFPRSLWERGIDCGAAPLWLMIRSRPCIRQSHLKAEADRADVAADQSL